MLLSIIIVNYNVKYFLEQCLCSVEKALQTAGLELASSSVKGLESVGSPEDISAAQADPREAEIFVVDNHSSDGSADWLPARFPQVQFILNDDNKGFGAANNQALARAKGKHILFLNPDTILSEDSFTACLEFMGSHPAAGAVGLRMIDGGGHFLKESRRGFPSPWVAFCKLSGLSGLFPRSAAFAGYYLGHIPPTADHPAPILPGAFMFVRKEALDQTGGFDERFFLYAEDIDLSYRIEQAGYSNYYLAAPTILHFKGESTQKDVRYVKLFYRAMSQFRRKHFKGVGSRLFNFLLEGAVWARGGLAAIRNAFRRGERPALQAGIGAGRRAIRVCGDGQAAARLRTLLSAKGRTLAIDAGSQYLTDGSAEEIIFCEGPGFSFKEIIRAMEAGANPPPMQNLHPVRRQRSTRRPAPMYKIHASHSAAAVGSPSKKERGDTILL